ncbi:MAG: hypothetical protein H7329_01615 [Opitutaceae bacterium]|nr:hypothetical protein [Cytophagales bacterium]
MLEYAKIILQKVSFDSLLFEKELRKALAELSTDEPGKLYAWCMDFFGDTYPETIQRVFTNFTNNPTYNELIRIAGQTLL